MKKTQPAWPGAFACGVWFPPPSAGRLGRARRRRARGARAQVLSTRARKDVKVADIKVQVCLFAFDCLYLDGRVLLQRPLTERRAALYSAVGEQPGELLFAVAKARRAGPGFVARGVAGEGALRRQR